MTRSAFTEPRACPICGHAEAAALIELPDFQFFLDPPRRVDVRTVQCERCACLYMNPVYAPGAVSELFREGGMSYRANPERVGEQADWLARRGRLGAGATVLDVGCFDGRFLAALPRHVRKLGVDVDAPAVQRARERLAGEDAQIAHGDVDALPPGPSPDTIALFHLLEHVPEPVGLLRSLRAAAGTKTRLVVEVPVVERGITNDLVGFFSVQHTTHFSRRSLENALWRAGWEPQEIDEEMDYNGHRVLATPAAREADPVPETADLEAARLAVAAWDAAAQAVTARLASVGDRCQIWGAGLHLEYLFQRTPLFATSRDFTIVDSDPLKQGGAWRAHAIGRPLTPVAGVPLVISSYDSQDEIAAAAIDLGARAEDIVRLYDRVVAY